MPGRHREVLCRRPDGRRADTGMPREARARTLAGVRRPPRESREGDGPPGGELPLRHHALLLGRLARARARRPLSRATWQRSLSRVQRPAPEGRASRREVTPDAGGPQRDLAPDGKTPPPPPDTRTGRVETGPATEGVRTRKTVRPPVPNSMV